MSKRPDITVDEILKKIEEEIGIKNGAISDDRSLINGNVVLHNPQEGVKTEDELSAGRHPTGLISRTLWKYGTRYALPIKKIPGLRTAAEYFYWKLSGDRYHYSQMLAAPASDDEILRTNLNFAGFIEGLKHDGLKGKIKRRIFTVIGFFAWWQGQVNRALYNKLAEQDAYLAKQQDRLAEQQDRLAEQEARMGEMKEIVGRLIAESATRDTEIRDLERRLSVLSRLEDAVYEELTSQRIEMARQRGWPVRSRDSGTDSN